MSKASQATETAQSENASTDIIQLDEKAQAAFDKHKAAQAKVRAASKHEDTSKEAKAEFAGYMGEARLGKLPDGRIVTRITQVRNYKAKAATSSSWDEFNVLGE